MEHHQFFHICADGADAKNFIICEEDFRAAFNLTGVAAANCNVTVLAFSIEDSHPHFLLRGLYEECLKFKDMFEASYKRYIVWSRGSLDGVILNCILYEITNEEYLMNVGTYVIIQATKDGKKVMPYDYPWGTGALYFRSKYYISPWRFGEDGCFMKATQAREIPAYIRAKLFHTTMDIPADWLICDGLILPDNYVGVKAFEKIYKTHNCFRTFFSSGRSKETPIIETMARVRGITMEDMELRKPCGDIAEEYFGKRDIRKLKADERLRLAVELRKRFNISLRQIATLVRLPLSEIEKYIR